MSQNPSLDLDRRTGWPADLRLLIDRYPRPTWSAHPNLGALSRFWLDRHAGFRELASSLGKGAVELREGRLDAAEFQPWFAPRMRFFLQQLHHHHLIEDQSYFPVFMAAEPRLALGFETLEADHDEIHSSIEKLAKESNELMRALRAPGADRRGAAAKLATAMSVFLTQLGRHLEDEEDLIIPLILERSEAGLGVG